MKAEKEVKSATEVAAAAQAAMQDIAKDSKRSMEEVGIAVQNLKERHQQEIEELEDLLQEEQQRAAEAEQAAEKAKIQPRTQKVSAGTAQEQLEGWTVGSVVAAAATGAAGIKRDRARVQQDMERAAMTCEDMRAMCVEHQWFVAICTVAEVRQQKKAAKIRKWAAEIKKWKKEKKQDKE